MLVNKASDWLTAVLPDIKMPGLTIFVFQPPLLDIVLKVYTILFITVSRIEHNGYLQELKYWK